LRESFFDLGGDSMIGVQLLSRLHDTFGVALSLETLFNGPTVEQLALAVEEAILTEIETGGPAPRAN
jgi:acyl carrier protein